MKEAITSRERQITALESKRREGDEAAGDEISKLKAELQTARVNADVRSIYPFGSNAVVGVKLGSSPSTRNSGVDLGLTGDIELSDEK